MTESVRARRCERHTTPDVGHRKDDDRYELGLRSCILGRSFDTRLVHGESTGSRDRMPFGEMSPTCLIQWVHRWSTLGQVVGTTECMAAAAPGFTWSRARVQVSCDTGTGSGGSLEQSGEANRDVEIASRGNLVVTET